MVPGIEHLPAELHIESLAYAGVLENAEVPVIDAWLLDGVAAPVSFHVDSLACGVYRIGEGCRVNIGIRQAAPRRVGATMLGRDVVNEPAFNQSTPSVGV
jgi:hypothetical protein